MTFFHRWLDKWRPHIARVRDRAKRPPEAEEPPAFAGVGAPLIPRTPILSGANARPWPPEED